MKNEMKRRGGTLAPLFPSVITKWIDKSKMNEFLPVKMPTNVGIATFIGI